MNEWESRYQTKDMPWEKGAPSPGLVDFLSDLCSSQLPSLKPGSSRIAIPGCGTGNDVRAWAKAGFQAFGFDIAPTAVRIAGEQTVAAGLSAEFHLGNFLTDSPPFLFDCVFEHTLFCATQ